MWQWVWGGIGRVWVFKGMGRVFLRIGDLVWVVFYFFFFMKCRFSAGEGPACKPTPGSKRGPQKPARPSAEG